MNSFKERPRGNKHVADNVDRNAVENEKDGEEADINDEFEKVCNKLISDASRTFA